MLTKDALAERLAQEFTPSQATLLSEVIIEAYGDLVKARDFNELKEIVRDLAEAQQRTEEQLGQLTARVDSLAEAQRRTEQRLEELAAAQQRTEEELRLLARGLRETRSELAGLSRQFGYALENEAYRALPSVPLFVTHMARPAALKRAEKEGIIVVQSFEW